MESIKILVDGATSWLMARLPRWMCVGWCVGAAFRGLVLYACTTAVLLLQPAGGQWFAAMHLPVLGDRVPASLGYLHETPAWLKLRLATLSQPASFTSLETSSKIRSVVRLLVQVLGLSLLVAHPKLVGSLDATLLEGVADAHLSPCLHSVSSSPRRIGFSLCLCASCLSSQWFVLIFCGRYFAAIVMIGLLSGGILRCQE